MSVERPPLGHGIGLRAQHFPDFLAQKPPVEWVEAISENFMGVGGRPMAVLEKVRRDMPVVLHGVSLSIGSVAPLKREYLVELKELVSKIEPALVSDHLCWGAHGARYAHDLWPLPYTEEALAHVASRVMQVQEFLGRPILLENVSSYVAYRQSEMSEWEFLSQVAQRADCGILLDINNIYVSGKNHGFSADDYIQGVPGNRVAQFHLAGHSNRGTFLLDTHDAPVPEPVWDLYRKAVQRFGAVPTLVEWDDHLPALQGVVDESQKARVIEQALLFKQAVGQ